MWGRKSPLSSEPSSPTVMSNAFYNANQNVPYKTNPLFDPLLPKKPESFKSPLPSEPTPTVTSNAVINDTEANILKENSLYNPKRKVSLFNKLPEGFIKAMRIHGTPVKTGKGGARRRTKYKRAKKRSLKSRKKSKV